MSDWIERGGVVRSASLKTSRGRPVSLPPLLFLDENRELWRAQLDDPESMVVIDLFCGAGGLSLGFQQAGFTIGAGFDSDPFACETFRANLLANAFTGDLKDVEPAQYCEEHGIQRVDVIIGGPPCQGFSRAGLAKVRHLGDQIAERVEQGNKLYRQFVRFVRELKPLMFVMENVPHLGNFRDGEIAAQITVDFQSVGYRVFSPMVLDAPDFGVPQTRRRLFFVGVDSHLGWVFREPVAIFGTAGNNYRTLADAIADLPVRDAPAWEEVVHYVEPDWEELETKLGVAIDHEYSELMRSQMPTGAETLLYDHIVRDVRDDDRYIFSSMKPGDKYKDVDARFRRYAIKQGEDGSQHFNDRYYRLQWDRPCVTITAHMAKDGYRYIHPDQIRTLSVREAARVQSFPDHFRFAGYRSSWFRQIGNAVPPMLAHAIAGQVAEVIRGSRTGQLVELDHQKGLPGFDDLLLRQGA